MIYAAAGPLLSPGSKKWKSMLLKEILISKKWNFLATKKLTKTFWNFLAPKNLIKLFYTLHKTPLGEAGCLSNFIYLLVAQASIFLNLPPFPQHSQLGHAWYLQKIHFQNYSFKKIDSWKKKKNQNCSPKK